MKCPKCGKELLIRDEKVSVNENGEEIYNQFAVCTDCKKKWNLDKQRAKKAEQAAADAKAEQEAAALKAAKEAAQEAALKAAPVKKSAPAKKSVPVKKEAPAHADAPVRKQRSVKKDTAVMTQDTIVKKEASPKKAPAKRPSETAPAKKSRPKTSHQTYSNIPPKDVRHKREEEMRKGYDELLSITEETEKGSKAPVIILVILIIAALGAAGTIFFCKMTDRPVPFISQNVQEETVITASANTSAEELPEELQNVEF